MSASIATRRLVVIGCGVLFAAFTPAAIAAGAPVPLQVSPTVDEYSPAATASFEAWEQNSVSSPEHWNVFAEPRAGGASWKVNALGTEGFRPSPVAGTESIIYQQAGRSSNLFLYNLSTRVRKALPAKVNSTAWEYRGVASAKYVAFMRLTSKARVLLLYNRSTGGLTQIASTKTSCTSCLDPTWVGMTHLAYETCSPTTYACNAKVLTIGGSTVTVPRNPAPYSNYGASVDEATGDVYFVSSTAYCGLFVSIDRWNLGGGAASSLYDLPEAFDVIGTVSLAPDTTTPTSIDALYSQFDCLAENYDNYELPSANTLAAVNSSAVVPAATAAGRTPRDPGMTGAVR